MNKLSAVYLAFCLLMPATLLAQVTTAELQVVQLYTQDELLQLIRQNQHLKRIKADD